MMRKALELRRTVDWEKLKTTIRFEDAGITICAEENEEHLSYTRIKSAFESLHLWLVSATMNARCCFRKRT